MAYYYYSPEDERANFKARCDPSKILQNVAFPGTGMSWGPKYFGYLVEKIRGTIYGNCVGDAMGLLTEFMTKEQAEFHYGNKFDTLKYSDKVSDPHRDGWDDGDWTDDSDQMFLIMQTLNSGTSLELDIYEFARKLKYWMHHGFPELGDKSGSGLGKLTYAVIGDENFVKDPHQVAFKVWESSGRTSAPNGAVMRTAILGIHVFTSLKTVLRNTVNAALVTHADPRCVASCIAVTTAIVSLLSRKQKHLNQDESYNISSIIEDSYNAAATVLTNDQEKQDLKWYMTREDLTELELNDISTIGYTFKCMGAGFWALKQTDFKLAIMALLMEAGDADTNCTVAGAMLGCKLGYSAIPEEWINNLKHKKWLDEQVDSYLVKNGIFEKPEPPEGQRQHVHVYYFPPRGSKPEAPKSGHHHHHHHHVAPSAAETADAAGDVPAFAMSDRDTVKKVGQEMKRVSFDERRELKGGEDSHNPKASGKNQQAVEKESSDGNRPHGGYQHLANVSEQNAETRSRSFDQNRDARLGRGPPKNPPSGDVKNAMQKSCWW